MNPKKRKALQKAGWTVGGVKELLKLSKADMKMIDYYLSEPAFIQLKKLTNRKKKNG